MTCITGSTTTSAATSTEASMEGSSAGTGALTTAAKAVTTTAEAITTPPTTTTTTTSTPASTAAQRVEKTEAVSQQVKVGKQKFNCKFKLVYTISPAVLDLGKSSAACSPRNKKGKAGRVRLTGGAGTQFTLSLVINQPKTKILSGSVVVNRVRRTAGDITVTVG